jgi:hypothetical protein
LGARVILQAKASNRLGIIFDDDGVRGVFVDDAEEYADGKPCYLLVSADGPDTSPLIELAFCTVTIVVTSPNLKANLTLKAWQKRADAYHFISPPPSCPEVVYLLYAEFSKSLLLIYLLTSPFNLVPKFGCTIATWSIGCIKNGLEISESADVIAEARIIT